MKLIDRGYIFDAEKATGPFRVCSFIGLCRLSSGAVLSSFRLGSGKDTADANCRVEQSDDNGKTWRMISDGFDRKSEGVDGEIRETDLMELEDGSPAAFITWIDRSAGTALYNADTDSILPSRLLLARSNTDGTWQSGQRLQTAELTGAVLTGPCVHIPGKGHLAFFENFEHKTGGAQSIHSAHALFSQDGQSFDTVINVARHDEDKLFYWDQRHAICPKTGRLVGMFWTYDRKQEHDMDIHIAWGDPETLTWEKPFSTGIKGQITAPIPLPDGRLLAFYVHRHHPGSMRLIASHDSGKTWDHDSEVVVYDSVAEREPEMNGQSNFGQVWEDMASWFFGHPTGVVLDEQTVLLSYYGGPNDKCLSVHWAKILV
jgi:hypothetical protein